MCIEIHGWNAHTAYYGCEDFLHTPVSTYLIEKTLDFRDIHHRIDSDRYHHRPSCLEETARRGVGAVAFGALSVFVVAECVARIALCVFLAIPFLFGKCCCPETFERIAVDLFKTIAILPDHFLRCISGIFQSICGGDRLTFESLELCNCCLIDIS